MATPWKDMELALWDWITGDPGYAALGLVEYRGYLGDRFPWDLDDEDEAIHSQALPSLEIWADTMAIPNPSGSDNAGQALDNMHLVGRLAFSAQGADRTRHGTIEPAVDLIAARLQSSDGRAGFGVQAVHYCTFAGGAVKAEMDASGGRVSIWIWDFEVTLQGHPRNLNA